MTPARRPLQWSTVVRNGGTLDQDLDSEGNRSQHLLTVDYVLGSLPGTILYVLANFSQHFDVE